MKTLFNKILILVAITLSNYCMATDGDTTKIFDLLKPTSSSAFILLGSQANDVESPTSPVDLAISIGNATNKFSSLPSAYALDINPAWVFAKKKTGYKYDSYVRGNDVGYNLFQTLRFSVGSNTLDSTKERSQKLNQTALGLKVSLLRGSLDNDSKAKLDSLHVLDSKILDVTNEAIKYVSEVLKIDAFVSPDQFKTKKDSVEKELLKKYKFDKISYSKNYVETSSFGRKGLKIDLSGGIVYDFLNQDWENKFLSKYVVWTTIAYEPKDDNIPTILGIVRVQNDKSRSKTNENSINSFHYLDLGARILFERNKVNLSFEYVLRNKLEKNNVFDNGNRFVFNFDYKISKTQSLTFSFGKNFKNEYYRNGNLIAAVNFIAGFGTLRNLIR